MLSLQTSWPKEIMAVCCMHTEPVNTRSGHNGSQLLLKVAVHTLTAVVTELPGRTPVDRGRMKGRTG